MKALFCIKHFLVFFFLQTTTSNAQTTFSNEDAIEFIKDYYSRFERGYSWSYGREGNHKILSNNYNATFSGSIFTLTFDTFGEDDSIQKNTTGINLKDVISIEHHGTENIEIYANFEYESVADILGLSTEKEMFRIPIYYDLEEDVPNKQIYKAFEAVWKYHQSKK